MMVLNNYLTEIKILNECDKKVLFVDMMVDEIYNGG